LLADLETDLLLTMAGSTVKKSIPVDANAIPTQEKEPLRSILPKPQKLQLNPMFTTTEIVGNSNGIHHLNM
jgi:hypothetical protein